MIRKLKALSLALGAVFAMGAMMASTASATDVFTNKAGKGSDLLTGVSTDTVLTVGNSSVKCKTSRFAATATHGASLVTVDAEYFGTPNKVDEPGEHCGNFEKLAVDMNGCDYDLGNTVSTKSGIHAEVWITCPVGKEVIITNLTTAVTFFIPEQTQTAKEGGITYTNLPSHSGGESIEVKETVKGITYACAPAFTCGLLGIPTEADDATYTGHVVLTCYEDLNANGVITPTKEGAQTGCKIS
jgi:hypothetical protein